MQEEFNVTFTLVIGDVEITLERHRAYALYESLDRLFKEPNPVEVDGIYVWGGVYPSTSKDKVKITT
jgi:hypothetical protein